jgi:hypothetical protein
VENTSFPTATNAAEIQAVLDPSFIKAMPPADGWSNAFEIESSATSYTIASQGKDGTGNDCAPGTTSNFNDEICFSNGRFQRFPSGPQQ